MTWGLAWPILPFQDPLRPRRRLPAYEIGRFVLNRHDAPVAAGGS